jgi:hypothetical protein
MVDPISKLGASLLNRSFHGSLLSLFRLDVFLSNFHFTSRQFLGGHHIVDGLDAITQDLFSATARSISKLGLLQVATGQHLTHNKWPPSPPFTLLRNAFSLRFDDYN